MQCFVDFDDTLMDRQQMAKDMYAAFGDVPTEKLMAHYAEFRKFEPFTIKAYTEYVKQFGIDGDRLREVFLQFALKSSDYVVPEAVDFLNALKAAGFEVSILSKDAEPELWQLPKINASGLVDLVSKVHVTTGAKSTFLKTLGVSDAFVFIDDKESEIDEMRLAFPHALCVRHARGQSLLEHLDVIVDYGGTGD